MPYKSLLSKNFDFATVENESQQSEGRGISRHLESPGQKQLVGPVIASSAKPEGLNLYSKEKLGK
jgi:hypothetical protein